MKKTIIIIIILVLLAAVGYFVTKSTSLETKVENTDEQVVDSNMEEETPEEPKTETVIGISVEGRDINAYHFGTGEDEILLVGGIHGGYEWNTSKLSFELVDYLKDSPDIVSDNLKVTVIPVLNPDGLETVVGTSGRFSIDDVADDTVSGRFNANGVDLNRNFDCDWQSVGVWQNKDVDGGDRAFSEPESQALRDYVNASSPKAVVVYYSSAGGVFASSCHNGISTETKELTDLYSDASGYPAYQDFDFYEITGDAVNWLAREGVPAISVLLTNHTSTELSKNKAGLEAVLEYYKK